MFPQSSGKPVVLVRCHIGKRSLIHFSLGLSLCTPKSHPARWIWKITCKCITFTHATEWLTTLQKASTIHKKMHLRKVTLIFQSNKHFKVCFPTTYLSPIKEFKLIDYFTSICIPTKLSYGHWSNGRVSAPWCGPCSITGSTWISRVIPNCNKGIQGCNSLCNKTIW